jgi:hypothetical protein
VDTVKRRGAAPLRARGASANVRRVPEPAPKPRRSARPPETGWQLGASGLSKVAWGILAVLLVALGVLLLVSGYIGYGGIILILAAAAAVNLL